jgi:hypothetical protein
MSPVHVPGTVRLLHTLGTSTYDTVVSGTVRMTYAVGVLVLRSIKHTVPGDSSATVDLTLQYWYDILVLFAVEVAIRCRNPQPRLHITQEALP